MFRASAWKVASAAFLTATIAFPLQAFSEGAFTKPHDFKGSFRVESSQKGGLILPSSGVRMTASGLVPGQQITLQRGLSQLNDTAAVADDKGRATLEFNLPADAATGMHPVIAVLENPSMVTLVDVKISQELPYLGEDRYDVAMTQPAGGLYQTAYSPSKDVVFLTAADFSKASSELMKLDPQSLEVLARITPADFPEDQKPQPKEGAPAGRFKLAPAGVFGVGLDEKAGTIWVTNTPDNTIAVYSQDDLSLIHQFAPDTVYHSRDVKIDSERGRAYVSSSASSNVHVFDTTSFEKLGVIDIRSSQRGGDFYVMSIALDPAMSELYVVSRVSNELAVVDMDSLEVKRVTPIQGAKNASGVDVDPATGRIFVAAQDSDNLLILDRETAEVLHDVPVGAGALNVVYDASSDLAWVSSRGAGTISAVNAEGEIVAHLDGGSYANHVTVDGKGAVFAVNKSLGEDDDKGDFIRRITPKQ